VSLRQSLFNRWLRVTEKRAMAREPDPLKLRRRFEFTAGLAFWPPRGSVIERDTCGGVPVARVRGPGVAEGGRVILHIHGGAFVMGSTNTHKGMLAKLSQLSGLPVVLPEYRLAPEHKFPAAVEDVRAVWEALLDEGFAPSDIILGGDSAGGALALGLLGALCAEGAEGPRGTFVLSPLTDLGAWEGSRVSNAKADPLLPIERITDVNELYMGDADVTDPRASPVWADFTGASPVWITVAETEVLLDDSLRMAERLRAAGVEVTLERVPDSPHVWPMFWRFFPEGYATLAQLADWITGLSGPRHDS
jgi:acetyl esterase/lipase